MDVAVFYMAVLGISLNVLHNYYNEKGLKGEFSTSKVGF